MTPTGGAETDGPSGGSDGPAEAHSRGRRWWRVEAGYLLELSALCGFVFTHPVLDTFGRSPETFLAHNASRGEILLFALLWALGPALLVWLLCQTGHLAPGPWRRRVHVAAVALLLAALAFEVLQATVGWPLALVVVAAIAIGAAAITLYLRVASVAVSYLRIASIAPVAFAAIFVFASPTSPLIFGGTVGAADVEVPDDSPDVVLVVFDMFPTASLLDGQGGIDADLYPNFARLAEESTWYRNSSTAAPWTNMALPSIVAGRYPDSSTTAPVAERYPNSLFTLLGSTYGMHVTEVITRVCPYSLCPAENHGGALAGLFGEGVDVISENAWERGPFPFEMEKVLDADRPLAFEEYVDAIVPDDQPTLHFLHSLVPHDPWSLLPKGGEYAAPDVPIGLFYSDWGGEQSVAIGRQRHLLMVQLADRLLGDLVEHLEETGQYDDSLVIVTADHGVAFRDGDAWRGVSADNFEEIAWTPLFVKEPGQAQGRVDDANVMSIDLLPSIADLLDVEIPADWELDGRSFVSGRPRDPAEKRIFEWNVNELEPTDGKLVVLDGVEGFRRLIDAPAPVGPGDDDLRIWRQGRWGSLVGRPLDQLRIGGPAETEAWLVDTEPYDDVDLDDHPPVHLHARLSQSPGADVAVAVNGTIAGWSPTVGLQAKESDFWTLLATRFLRDGPNDVRCFTIEEIGGEVVLHPIPWRER